jgi:hypothetical protein
MFVPNREALAWAAGFFDGEGHVGLNNRGYLHLDVSQANDPLALDKFAQAIGFLGKTYGPFQKYGRRKKRVKPIYQYRVATFTKVQAVMALLWPFLCPVKRAQWADAQRRFLAKGTP